MNYQTEPYLDDTFFNFDQAESASCFLDLIMIRVFFVAAYFVHNFKPSVLGFEADQRLSFLNKRFFKTDPYTTNYRLPNVTSPLHYELEVQTKLRLIDTAASDEDDLIFSGRVIITLEALKETSEVILHSRNLQIISAEIFDPNQDPVDVISSEHDFQTEFLSFKLSKALQQGLTYKLRIEFTGNVSTIYAGFYYTSYTTKGGEKRNMAATMFASINARQVFPCYDEPGYRSTFNLKVKHRRGLRANSNMPIIDVDDRFVFDSYLTSRKILIFIVTAKKIGSLPLLKQPQRCKRIC